MKLKALLLALFTAGFAVSIAVAASPAAVEKGKPTVSVATTGTDTTGTTTTSESTKGKGHAKQAVACKPAKKILVSGELVAANVTGFSMKVTGGNKAGKALKGLDATVLVDDKTKFKGKKRSFLALAKGDRVTVQGYACKVNVTSGAILARMVMTKGPKGADDDEAGTTTTATTTAVTTTAATTTTAVTTTAP